MFLQRLFQPRAGGTFVGNLIRGFLNEKTHGVFDHNDNPNDNTMGSAVVDWLSRLGVIGKGD